MRTVFTVALFIFVTSVVAQPNCEYYKLNGEKTKYKACKQALKARGYYQFSKEYQIIMDKSIQIDSTFDYPYWAKSIAYLKSGDFLTWKKLIDKAVDLNPTTHLGYRGWCRYQFFKDYQGAINDVEALDSLVTYDIGHSQNGTYHLNVAKGLWYSALGHNKKALKLLEDQIEKNEKEDFVGVYDYLHLGVLYLKNEQFNLAISAFKKQTEINPLAENQYYMALAHFNLGNYSQYQSCLKKAKELYLIDRKMFDTYSHPMHKIYLDTIETELNRANNIANE